MLSICVPIYNYNSSQLLIDLVQQAQLQSESIEIICIDDASSELEIVAANEVVIQSHSIQYERLRKNIGRSKIRNLLAHRAKYPYVLFVDCDVSIPPLFIQNYTRRLGTNKVLYGGTKYPDEKPADVRLLLHYHYGHQKESLSVAQRSKKPYHSFKTNNFLAPRYLILNTPFDESIQQYGHEDTIWAFNLRAQNIPILHIDNPITHLGLETHQDLIRKIEASLENMVQLQQSDKDLPIKVNQIFRQYKGLWSLCSTPFIKRILRKQLMSKKPSLNLLDLYKLLYLAEINS